MTYQRVRHDAAKIAENPEGRFVSRVSRVPLHQNAYDLVGRDLAPIDKIEMMIRRAEVVADRALPTTLRELYVMTGSADYFGWYDYPSTVRDILEEWVDHAAAAGELELGDYSDDGCDLAVIDDSDDPLVYRYWWRDVSREENLATREVVRFRDYVFEQACSQLAYFRDISPAWLVARDEPFAPPVIDFLTEQIGEADRTPRPDDVTTYTFRTPGGTIRVTADEPTLAGGLSAWWIHADTPEGLADLARLVAPFGTLRETLRADTDPAKDVLKSIRE